MVVAQAAVLLAVDVACIVAASTAGDGSQKWWFLSIPSGSFVLETAVGMRDIMHVFIEVLLVGIGIAAYIAAKLICQMRQKKRSLRKAESESAAGTGVSGGHISTRSKSWKEDTQNGSSRHSAPSLSKGKVGSTIKDQRVKAAKKQRSRLGGIDIEGIEKEAAVLLLLILTVIGMPLKQGPQAHNACLFYVDCFASSAIFKK